jgi:hypothetical protein
MGPNSRPVQQILIHYNSLGYVVTLQFIHSRTGHTLKIEICNLARRTEAGRLPNRLTHDKLGHCKFLRWPNPIK